MTIPHFDADRIYIAGPMSGLPDNNRPAFFAAEKALTAAGYSVWNPVRNGLPLDAAWSEHMRVDIAALVTCGRIALLPGWEKSTGANLELKIAVALGMEDRSCIGWIMRARNSQDMFAAAEADK